MRFFLPQLAELGLIGIATVFPAPRHELSAFEVRVAVAGVPPLHLLSSRRLDAQALAPLPL